MAIFVVIATAPSGTFASFIDFTAVRQCGRLLYVNGCCWMCCTVYAMSMTRQTSQKKRTIS